MLRYITRRLLWTIPVLLFISIITFALAHAVPGGPFTREKPLPPEIIANLNKYYGLDKPIWQQYLDYMGKIITKFDFGPSYASRSITVNDIFRDHLPVSAELGVFALAIAILIGVPLGVVAALKQNTVWDYMGMGVAIFGVCAGAAPDMDLCARTEMVPRGRLGNAREGHHACRGPWPWVLRSYREADAGQHASGRSRGLHSHGPR
jgi:ABC-type microcin C transport system permease subunit YejB